MNQNELSTSFCYCRNQNPDTYRKTDRQTDRLTIIRVENFFFSRFRRVLKYNEQKQFKTGSLRVIFKFITRGFHPSNCLWQLNPFFPHLHNLQRAYWVLKNNLFRFNTLVYKIIIDISKLVEVSSLLGIRWYGEITTANAKRASSTTPSGRGTLSEIKAMEGSHRESSWPSSVTSPSGSSASKPLLSMPTSPGVLHLWTS